MTLLPLLPLFHRLNSKYFEGSLVTNTIPLIRISWSDGRLKSTAGFYRRRLGLNGKKISEIVLSRPLLEHLPLKALESTLCHEMIHAWIDLILNKEEVGHGPLFRKRMSLINSSQKDFEITIRHAFPIPSRPSKWIGICPSCGQNFLYKRLLKRAACRRCCDKYFDGAWNKSCLLSFQPVAK